MPLDRLVLILVAVIAAAGATVWIAATVLAASASSGWGWFALVPTALGAYVAWRVVADRVASEEDDRYDRIER